MDDLIYIPADQDDQGWWLEAEQQESPVHCGHGALTEGSRANTASTPQSTTRVELVRYFASLSVEEAVAWIEVGHIRGVSRDSRRQG